MDPLPVILTIFGVPTGIVSIVMCSTYEVNPFKAIGRGCKRFTPKRRAKARLARETAALEALRAKHRAYREEAVEAWQAEFVELMRRLEQRRYVRGHNPYISEGMRLTWEKRKDVEEYNFWVQTIQNGKRKKKAFKHDPSSLCSCPKCQAAYYGEKNVAGDVIFDPTYSDPERTSPSRQPPADLIRKTYY